MFIRKNFSRKKSFLLEKGQEEKMSKYKLQFSIGSGLGKESDEVDLVDDLGFTEKKAEETIKNENEQHKLFEEWRDENIDQNFGVVKENQEE